MRRHVVALEIVVKRLLCDLWLFWLQLRSYIVVGVGSAAFRDLG